MKHSFNCPPISANMLAEPLVFTWDPDTGEVTGPDAALVLDMATWGQVQAHPLPWVWRLSADPLRSWTDMAAIVGTEWHLPTELRAHYPKFEPPDAPTDDNSDPLPGFTS
jgi:hypothetical protein